MEAAIDNMLDPHVAERAAASPVLNLNEPHHFAILRTWHLGMAERANVSAKFLYTSAKDYVGPKAAKYLANLGTLMREQHGGFVLSKINGKPLDACSSMVAAAFRTKHTGRVILLKELLPLIKNNDTPDIAMIAVPDFFNASEPLTGFEQSLVMHFLNSRYLKCKATVLYVSSMKDLRKNYGEKIFEHLTTSYVIE
jgi:hypothetical protein